MFLAGVPVGDNVGNFPKAQLTLNLRRYTIVHTVVRTGCVCGGSNNSSLYAVSEAWIRRKGSHERVEKIGYT